MQRAVFLLPALLALLLVGAGSTDTPPASTPPEMARLVDQLGDPDFQQRQRATEALRRQGVNALPALRAALEHPDPEVRHRVQELVPALETAVLLSPRRVTLKVTDKTARQALDELAKQTGYGIDCWNEPPNQVYCFNLQDVTFWEALDKVAEEAGLVLQPSYGSDRVRLMAQNAYSPYVKHDGSFRLAAVGLSQVRNLDLGVTPRAPGTARRSNSLTFTFCLAAEPRFPLLAVGEPHVEAAYDSERDSLLPPLNAPIDDPQAPFGQRRIVSRYANRSLSHNIEIPLVRASEKATSIKVLRGTVPVTLLISQKQVLLTDKPLEVRNKKIVIDRITFVLEDIAETPTKQYQMRLSATEEGGDGTLLNSLYQRIEILDVRGNKMQIYSTGWSGNGNNSVRLTMTFGMPGAPMAPEPPGRISFQSWTTKVHPIDFEFRDLPLP
jgi:hypothetical protein